MKKNPWMVLLVLFFVFGTLFTFLLGSSVISFFGGNEVKSVAKNSIMHLKLEGVIMDGKKFLDPLLHYRDNKKIKGIVIEVDSPGGVVGPSQVIYTEIKRTRTEFKLPVVVVSNGLNASGAFYSSVAADKILVSPGTLIGSIGVIMEFANLQGLYDWAKVQRYSITTGKFKDSGAEYRSMRADERELFQSMINEVWVQFKTAVAEGRKMKPEDVEPYADGRVLTGAQAVKIGFADDFGTLEDGFRLAAEMAGLGKNYEVFEPPHKKKSVFDFIFPEEDDEAYTRIAGKIIDKVMKTGLVNRPLFLMPGVL